jgi:hypothetical protein
MSTTATTQIPPGIYRIVVAGGGLESQRLTNEEGNVTVLPPGVDNDPKQEVSYFHDELDCLSLTSPFT